MSMTKSQIEATGKLAHAVICGDGGNAIPLESHVEQIQPGWKTSEPPKDGTLIVAIGQVNYQGEFGGCVEPFLAAIRWEKTDSGFEGWMRGELSLTSGLDDIITIHCWIAHPDQEGK